MPLYCLTSLLLYDVRMEGQYYYQLQSPYGYSTPRKLWTHLNQSQPNISLSKVKQWYTTQEVPSRFAQAKKKFARSVFITSGEHVQWLADLADLPSLATYNKGYRYILVVQDLFTRRLLGLTALKTKTSKEVANALHSIISHLQVTPKIFFTDKGGEFKGAVNALYHQHGIEHVTSKDISQKAAPTERLIHFIKTKLFKDMAAKGTNYWLDKLDAVMTAINSDYSRTLGMTRNEAALPENKAKVYLKTVIQPEMKNIMLRKGKDEFAYKIGDTVRILMDQPFGKSYLGNYSQVLYSVKDHKIRGGVPVYFLQELLTKEPIEGSFYEQEMKKVILPANQPPVKDIENIYSFRMMDNKEQVQVSYPGVKGKHWINYSNLINYAAP